MTAAAVQRRGRRLARLLFAGGLLSRQLRAVALGADSRQLLDDPLLDDARHRATSLPAQVHERTVDLRLNLDGHSDQLASIPLLFSHWAEHSALLRRDSYGFSKKCNAVLPKRILRVFSTSPLVDLLCYTQGGTANNLSLGAVA